MYIRLAAASAREHPTRFPCLSRRLARAKVAANVALACSSARLTEAGVGWTSSCAPIDCGAIGPAFGFPADWRTACSNCAILLLHGPACAAATPRPRAAATSKVAESRLMARRRICEHLHDVFDRALPRFLARRRPDVRQGSVTSAGCRAPSCRPAVTEVLEKIGSARPARRGAPGARSAAHLADSSKAPKSDNKWVLGV